jgi:hypothetical protein
MHKTPTFGGFGRWLVCSLTLWFEEDGSYFLGVMVSFIQKPCAGK